MQNIESFETKDWYALCTHPRHEKSVHCYLESQQVTSFLPLYSRIQHWRNRMRATVELPLFPGYLFVQVPKSERQRILKTPGISRFVSFAGKPAVIPEIEIERLRCGLAGLDPEPCPYLRVGDQVRVKSGPLAGLQGMIITGKNHTRFVLAMDLLMRAISVEMDAVNLEPVVSSRSSDIQ